MYTFFIKDNNSPDLDIIITRAMLAVAAMAAFVYRSDQNIYLSLLFSAALFITAVFVKLLLVKFRINRFVLLSGAAVVLFIATRSISFAVILVLYGYLIKFLNQKPTIAISNKGVIIKKRLASPEYRWNEFSNIILKDSMLTLDFKNNKLIQVDIDENKTAIDENIFNEFCKGFIMPGRHPRSDRV